MTWDDLGQLSADRLSDATGTETAGVAYSYDDDSNVTAIDTDLPGNPASASHSYGYDCEITGGVGGSGLTLATTGGCVPSR